MGNQNTTLVRIRENNLSIKAMQDIAEIIVKKARMMPVDIGVALESNGATIAKVKVTGGIGLEVKVAGGAFTSEDRALLFPMVSRWQSSRWRFSRS